jgi:hypothetical protein
MFRQTFKNIDEVISKKTGCTIVSDDAFYRQRVCRSLFKPLFVTRIGADQLD